MISTQIPSIRKPSETHLNDGEIVGTLQSSRILRHRRFNYKILLTILVTGRGKKQTEKQNKKKRRNKNKSGNREYICGLAI